jgi:hypothetical protein
MLTLAPELLVAKLEPTCVQLLVLLAVTACAQSSSDVGQPVPWGCMVPPVICVMLAVVRALVVNVQVKSLLVMLAGFTVEEFSKFAQRQPLLELLFVSPSGLIADTVKPLEAEPKTGADVAVEVGMSQLTSVAAGTGDEASSTQTATADRTRTAPPLLHRPLAFVPAMTVSLV